jgi:hypothetical protein
VCGVCVCKKDLGLEKNAASYFKKPLWTLTVELMRQYCKTVVWGCTCGDRKVNEGDEGEGIWLMGFRCICEIERWNLLQSL